MYTLKNCRVQRACFFKFSENIFLQQTNWIDFLVLSLSVKTNTNQHKKKILLTIQRLDSTVDFSAIVVCEVAMIDCSKMTCREKTQNNRGLLLFPSKYDTDCIRVNNKPFPMIRWCCTISISAGIRTSFTSSSSSGLKLEIEIFSEGMSGVRVGSMLPVA